MNQHEEMTIPEYAKTGLDMANLFGVSANEGKIDYEEFSLQMIKYYVSMTQKEQMQMLQTFQDI